MDYKTYIAKKLDIKELSVREIAESIEIPPDISLGDFALPCFPLSKIMRKAPNKIAE